MNTNKKPTKWLDYESYKVEKDFMKKKKAEVFPIMSMSDEDIEKMVREQYKDEPVGIYEFPDIGVLTGKEGAIKIEIAIRKEVRDMLNK